MVDLPQVYAFCGQHRYGYWYCSSLNFIKYANCLDVITHFDFRCDIRYRSYVVVDADKEEDRTFFKNIIQPSFTCQFAWKAPRGL